MEILSWRANWRHISLEKSIRELDTSDDVSRSGITNRAIICARDVEDWCVVRSNLAAVVAQAEDNSPVISMQARPNEQAAALLPEIRQKMISDLRVDSGRLYTPYMVQLLWANYLQVLRLQVLSVGADRGSVCSSISGPDMVKLLVEMLLYDREKDKLYIERIKAILSEWKWSEQQ